MSSIALPKKIEFIKGETDGQGVIAIEPCYPGYGITLGNALRRVMLSSLPGAAVVGVKIKGASHEFMSIPHIKEDVLEIILNLKQLRLSVFTDEIVKLELDVHGEKEAKAGDIMPNSDVKIANPDLVLAHITDMAGNLHMEIYVSRGKGYETVESREKKNTEIGYIETDSIFSPILNVGVHIENVRVGKMTNWEKLTLDVLTDGTITPEEAFNQSVSILINQFNALIGIQNQEKLEEESTEEKIEDEEEFEQMTEEDAESMIIDVKDDSKKKRGRPKKG